MLYFENILFFCKDKKILCPQIINTAYQQGITTVSYTHLVVLVNQECDKLDIIIRVRDHTLHRIAETHRAYDGLQYPLTFCRGEDGYHFTLKLVDPQTGLQTTNSTVTLSLIHI